MWVAPAAVVARMEPQRGGCGGARVLRAPEAGVGVRWAALRPLRHEGNGSGHGSGSYSQRGSSKKLLAEEVTEVVTVL